jgi:hypothetical protein
MNAETMHECLASETKHVVFLCRIVHESRMVNTPIGTVPNLLAGNNVHVYSRIRVY